MANLKPPPAESERKVINSWDDVPTFETEAEEQTWWDHHEISEAMLEKFERVPLEGNDDLPPARTPTSSKPVTVRFETDILTRLKGIAKKKQMGYQTLLKEFVVERLYEEEKREGVL